MKKNLVINNQTNYKIDPEIFYDIIKNLIKSENLQDSIIINLLFVNDVAIKRLNLRYRGVNSATDVLSFPINIPEINLLGDIIIDISYAEKQKGRNSLKDELRMLFAHGCLHLLGYDHISSKQKNKMNEKQEIILNTKGD